MAPSRESGYSQQAPIAFAHGSESRKRLFAASTNRFRSWLRVEKAVIRSKHQSLSLMAPSRESGYSQQAPIAFAHGSESRKRLFAASTNRFAHGSESRNRLFAASTNRLRAFEKIWTHQSLRSWLRVEKAVIRSKH